MRRSWGATSSRAAVAHCRLSEAAEVNGKSPAWLDVSPEAEPLERRGESRFGRALQNW